MKKLFSKFLPGVLVACCMVSISVGQSVVINANAPDITDALASDLGEEGDSGFPAGIDSSIFDEVRSTNHARGQIFTVPAGATEIASLTIRKSGVEQTFDAGDSLRLQIFEGDNTGFAFGFGHTTADDGDNFFVDTANLNFDGPIVPFFDETFAVEGLFEPSSYVSLNLSTPVALAGRTQIGFLLTFTDSNFDAADALDGRFRYAELANGNRCGVTTTAHQAGSSRSFQYALLSTVVEPEAEFVLGDVDLSGEVNFADIGPFIALLSGMTFQAEADIDGSGAVDFADIGPFIGLLSGSGS